MAQIQNPRRFYIDHGDNQPVVRAVPVRRREPVSPEPDPNQSPATHQITLPTPIESLPDSLRARARQAPRHVSRLVRSARIRPHLPRS